MKILPDLVETSLSCPRTTRDTQRRKYRTRLIMRVSFIYSILIVISGLLIHAHASYGQILEQRVTVGMDNEPLDVLFKRLEKQTPGVSWLYGSIKEPKVSFPRGDRSLKETLELGLKDSGYTYEVKSNDGILILREPRSNDDDANTGFEAKANFAVTITGTITDSVTQQPMPGVNVVVRGTSRGTSSDNEGNYVLAVDPSETLVFTFIGYKPLEVLIGNRTKINVALEQDVAMLGEVTVSTNYYETPDKLKTGNIIKVTAKEIENQPVTSPLMALQGRVPGLEITPSNGAPGVAPQIRIRGNNSLRFNGKTASVDDSGNYPLYVIDGVPLNSTPLSSWSGGLTAGGYDPISTLNPSSIESIEVLKDGDATAMYGSRGANGVIIITTKKNLRSKERTDIEVSAYSGIGKISKRLDLLNTEQYLSVRRESFANDGRTPSTYDFDLTLWDQSRYTDWQKVLLGGSANINDFQSAISSGNQNTSFRIGGGFHKETLIYPGNFGYKRGSALLNLNHRSANSKFNVVFSANFGLDNNRLFNGAGQLVSDALNLPPNAPKLYREDGTLNWELYSRNGFLVTSWTNPLSYLRKIQQTNTNNLITSTNLSYELLPGLSISTNAGYTLLNSTEKSQYPSGANPPDKPSSGYAYFLANSRNSWIIEPKLSFSRKNGDHTLNAIVGSTWQDSFAHVNLLSGEQYPSDALLGSIKGAGLVTVLRDDILDYKYMSIYSHIGYNWGQRYIINLTGRRDGSSRFGPGNRFGNFGAIGAAWVFSGERFFSGLTRVVNFGKLRASYGTTGSDQVGDYRYYDLYDVSQRRYNGVVGFTQSSPFNMNYAWEVTNKWEAALEFGVLQNRITLDINWYRNRSSNQLIDYTLPAITGFPSVLTNFPATVQNRGWEGAVKADVLSSADWRWNIALNLSLPRNVLLKFDGIEASPYASYFKIGQPLSVQRLLTYGGIDQATGQYVFLDQNTDGQINQLDETLQNPRERKYYGGLSNTIQYKGLNVSFLFQFSNQKGMAYFASQAPGRMNNQPIQVLNSWQHSGDQTSNQKISASDDALVAYARLLNSNFTTTTASFLRLKTVSIGYQMPQQILKFARVQEAKIFLQGQNIFTITNYFGLDPETGNGLPPLRMVTAGIQLKF